MNNYQICEEIGKGQYCTVYKGRKKKTIDYFAIMSVEKTQRARVLNEVQILHSFAHTHLVHFYNWYETNNHLWLILEYCCGGDLMTVLKQDKRLPEDTIRLFGRDLVAALAHIHSKGTIHCDLKPSNVLIDAGGFLKVRGFGRSIVIEKPLTPQERKERRGTVQYMAPELFRDEAMYSYRSDLWALGCLLYELAAGRTPWSDPNIGDLILQITSHPHERITSCSAEFNDLIDCLLQKDPLDRASLEAVTQHDFWKTKLAYLPPAPHPEWETYAARHSEERKDARPSSEEARRRREEVQRVSVVVENSERERRNVSRVQSREETQTNNSSSRRTLRSGVALEVSMFHPSDSNVKPIVFNPKIERENDNGFDPKDLPVRPRALDDIKKMDKAGLEALLKECVQELEKTFSDPIGVAPRVQPLVCYLESICIDTQIANVIVNGFLMPVLLQICTIPELPSTVRVRVCTLMGLLVRHATIVTAELGRHGIWNALLTVLRIDKNPKARRRCVACMGELLFYVATQTAEDRRPWGIDLKTFPAAYLEEVTTLDDEVAIHYYLRSMENLCGHSDTEVGVAFISQPCVRLLWDVVNSDRVRSDAVRAAAYSVLARMCRVHPPAVPWVLEFCPVSTWEDLIRGATSRSAQQVLNIINIVMCKGVAGVHAAGDAFLSKLVLRDPRQMNSTLFDPSAGLDAKALVAQISQIADKLCQAVVALLETSPIVAKIKCINFLALLFMLDADNVRHAFEHRFALALERVLLKEADGSVLNAYSVVIDVLRGLIPIAFNPDNVAKPSALQAVCHAVTNTAIRSDLVNDATMLILGRCMYSLDATYTQDDDMRYVCLIAEALSQDSTCIQRFSTVFATQYVPSLLHMMDGGAQPAREDKGDLQFLGLKMCIDVLSQLFADDALYEEVRPKLDSSLESLLGELKPLLVAEEPLPLYTLKLINVVSSRDTAWLAEVHNRGITAMFLAFFDLEHGSNNIHNVSLIHRCIATESMPLSAALEWRIVPKFESVLSYAHENGLESFQDECLEVMRSTLELAQRQGVVEAFAPWAGLCTIVMMCLRTGDGMASEGAAHSLQLLAKLYPQCHTDVLLNAQEIAVTFDATTHVGIISHLLGVLVELSKTSRDGALRGNEYLMLHVDRLSQHSNETIAATASGLLSSMA